MESWMLPNGTEPVDEVVEKVGGWCCSEMVGGGVGGEGYGEKGRW